MKKFTAFLLALVGGLWAAGNYLPGFWGFVPASLTASIPVEIRPVLESQFNLPKASEPAKAQAAKGGGQGGGGQGNRQVPVVVADVVRKTMPYRIDTIGTVQAIASVTVRSRVDSQIDQILFKDGAYVKEGDVLAKLDSRVIEAQIAQAEANLARDKATLVLAQSTLKRAEDLAQQNFATKQRLDENRAAVNQQQALVIAGEAQLKVLQTQFSYYTIRAPISGKAGVANLRPGNIARSSDGGIALTTINQMSPIYVSFSLPQRYLADLKAALQSGGGRVLATPQGGKDTATGRLELIENAMDNATGTLGVRASFSNEDEKLWPGLIVSVKVDLREDADAVVVPRDAVQLGQRGNYVFVVVGGVAKLQPVVVSRSLDNASIVIDGLKGGEQVIVDGHLQVVDGTRVQPRPVKSSSLNSPAPGGTL